MQDCLSQPIVYVLFTVSGFGLGIISCLVGYFLYKRIRGLRSRYSQLNGDREFFMEELQRVNIERDNARRETRDAIEERDKANLRLSELMSANLLDGNPNITDLSDENRPSKLCEKLSELYDNDYTEAMTFLLDNHIAETEVIRLLLDILRFVYESCVEASERQLALIHQLMRHPETILTDLDSSSKDKVLPKEILKRIKDMRKAIKPELSSISNKVTLQIRKTYTDFHYLDREPISTYIYHCAEVVWLMTVQDPPMFLEFHESRRENLRAFTRSGPELDFHVWPSLYLYKGGPVMAKGVSQFK